MQEVYRYAYGFSCEKGLKIVQLEMAVAMWQLIFSQRPWPLLDLWIDFLQVRINFSLMLLRGQGLDSVQSMTRPYHICILKQKLLPTCPPNWTPPPPVISRHYN